MVCAEVAFKALTQRQLRANDQPIRSCWNAAKAPQFL
jgi:hypothetical protein